MILCLIDDDLIDNRLIRPSKNHSYKLTVNIGLKLTQIIDIVSDWIFANILY